MFGYVKAYKPELRVKEAEFYKAVYCSICKQIGKNYGFISRFFLSYDFTFLTLLYMGLEDGCVCLEQKKCVYNPLKKCSYLKPGNTLPEMPMAATQIMLYYKLLDNIADEGFFKRIFYRFIKLLSAKGYKKAKHKFEKIDKIFSDYFSSQQRIEAQHTADIDAAADPTAQMLSQLFAMCSESGTDPALKRLGYCLGRWIYYIDAAADYKEDCRKGKYNPFAFSAEKHAGLTDLQRQKIKSTLYECINEAALAFELIDICRFKNILGNIIYLGLEYSQNKVLGETQE